MASGPSLSMFGSASGSFGTSARYSARWSAVRGNACAPSRLGRTPWPRTRTGVGSQNCGYADANVERSSMNGSKRGGGLSLRGDVDGVTPPPVFATHERPGLVLDGGFQTIQKG